MKNYNLKSFITALMIATNAIFGSDAIDAPQDRFPLDFGYQLIMLNKKILNKCTFDEIDLQAVRVMNLLGYFEETDQKDSYRIHIAISLAQSLFLSHHETAKELLNLAMQNPLCKDFAEITLKNIDTLSEKNNLTH